MPFGAIANSARGGPQRPPPWEIGLRLSHKHITFNTLVLPKRSVLNSFTTNALNWRDKFPL